MQQCKCVSGTYVAPIIPSLHYPLILFNTSQASSRSSLPLALQETKMKLMFYSCEILHRSHTSCGTFDRSLTVPKCVSSIRESSCFPFHQNTFFTFPGKSDLSSSCGASTSSIERSRNGCSSTIQMLSATPFITRASSSTMQPVGSGNSKSKDDVEMISSLKDFEETLAAAKSKLVVIEYAASHSMNSKRIYPAMVELSRTCPDVVFRLIMGDESDETKELCRREGVEKVPHFIFYKNMEKIHEEEGIDPDLLLGDVLYYGDNENLIQQLHGREDVEALIAKHAKDDKLIVLDVGLKHCGPCVKVYPTVIKLARKMADTTVFARMHGDENDSCMALLREMDVVEVPTFLFIREGKVCGRYVGSGRGELIGEILRYQGVRVTY